MWLGKCDLKEKPDHRFGKDILQGFESSNKFHMWIAVTWQTVWTELMFENRRNYQEYVKSYRHEEIKTTNHKIAT